MRIVFLPFIIVAETMVMRDSGVVMRNRILIIEDNNDLTEVISDYMGARSDGGFIIDSISKGDLSLVPQPLTEYEVIVLDIMLPGLDGYTLCSIIREKTSCPVILLSALCSEEERIRGYNCGADDFVCKPFSLEELYLKINVWIGRKRPEKSVKILSFEEICLNIPARMCTADNKQIPLTFIEFEILEYLIENKGRVLSREKLMDAIWPDKLDMNERTVDSHIRKLRNALGVYGKYINTVHGAGYCLRKQS